MKDNPERFTLLNRVPFGKFNKVNFEPVNTCDIGKVEIYHLPWLHVYVDFPAFLGGGQVFIGGDIPVYELGYSISNPAVKSVG